MKKTLLLITITALLTGCGGSNPSLRKTDLKILAPQGAPAVAMYNFVNGLTTVTNPQTELIPQFKQDTYDIIVAPAKGGLTTIVRQSANFQMAAVVTFGNFGLVATGNDDDGELNAGDKVLYFQPNDIPGKTFEYLYGDLGLTTYSVDAVNATATALNTGTYKVDETTTIQLDYVFSAEPLISNLNKVSQVKEWASDAFSNKTDGKRIIQAAVFVRKTIEKSKVDNFLSLLEKDLKDAVKAPKNIVNTFNLFGDIDEQANKFGVNADVVYKCMKDHNGLGLGYLRAKTVKDEVDYFVNAILNSGLTLDEEVYY